MESAAMLTSGASGRLSALISFFALRKIILLLNSLLSILLLPFRQSAVITATKKDSSAKSKIVVKVPVQLARPAGMRRQLAIKRVETAVKEDLGFVKREFELVEMERGETLFTQSWSPIEGKIKGLLVLMHGLNEHSGRYDHFAKKLIQKGFKVYAMDWIGHGGSESLHGYVHSLDHAVNDLKLFVNKVSKENPGLPCFLFGHSTGGAIILKVVLDPELSSKIRGIVMTSPAITVQPAHPLVTALAPIFSIIVPKYQFSTAQKNGPVVSRDPEALRSKYSDPLVFTGSIRVRTGYEILRITTQLQTELHKISVPFLVLHGESDLVTDPNGSKRLHEMASSEDKSIKLYEGLLHDLLIEPEKLVVMQDIVDWLELRV